MNTMIINRCFVCLILLLLDASVTVLECSKLAEHVVNRAKVRLQRQQKKNASNSKTATSLHEASNLHQSSSHLPELQTMTHLSSSSAIHKNAVAYLTSTKQHNASRETHSANSNLIDISSVHLVGGQVKDTMSAKILSWSQVKPASKVIYLSEKHSFTPKETGIPNVPPATPNEGTIIYTVHTCSCTCSPRFCSLSS